MSSEHRGPLRYRFGAFELRPDQGELLRRGRAVSLQPQPLKVLALLVSREGDLVRREELFTAIWGHETHVDYDRGLNYCIKQIRSALGDDAGHPRFVRTVPRHGYRFVAPVETSRRPSGAAPAPRAMRRAYAAAAATFAVLAITLGMAWWFSSVHPAGTTTGSVAMAEYLRGSALAESPSREDARRSLRHFRQAVELDPEFAPAHLGLARVLLRTGTDAPAALERSRSATERALELDGELAEAHAHLARLRLHGDWDWEGAEAASRRAVELRPDSAELRRDHAGLLALRGRHAEAIDQMERALTLDPVSTAVRADAGWLYYQAGRLDDAVRLCTATLDVDPENRNALWCLLQAHHRAGRSAQAVAAARRLAALLGGGALPAIEDLEDFWRWYVHWLPDHPGEGSLTHLGLGHLALGEHERALKLFEQAHAARSSCVLGLAADPQADPLRDDPRFDALLRRIGMGS